MAPSTFRLALLQCSKLAPLIVDKAGDYPQVYTQLLEESLALTNPGATKSVSFTLDTYDVKEQMAYPPDDISYDGLLISGSPSSPCDDIPWINKLVEYLANVIKEKPKMKIFGICFGHQVIARALGATCVRNDQWEVAVTTVQLTDLGKAILNSNDFDFDIQQMHHDHVPDVPAGCHLLGQNSITYNQGFVMFDDPSTPLPQDLAAHSLQTLPPIHIFAVQGHPEYTPRIMDLILELRSDRFGPQVTADGKRRASGIPGRRRADGRACDGVGLIARAMWGILGVA